MIVISALTQKDKLREVRYRTHGCTQWGKITSWNGVFIFVRYHAYRNDGSPTVIARTGDTSEATRPEDLEFCS